jgi:multidrug resistance efflux pump
VIYIILGVAGILTAAAGVMWYKIRQASNAQTDNDLQRAARERAEASQAAAEKQIAAQNENERKELNASIATAKEIVDPEARRRALLNVLYRLRGVH